MKRYFEYKEDKSSKFWEITLEKTTITTRYGKIGTDGQSSTKTLDTKEQAQKEFEKLIKAKFKKGYVEIIKEKQEKTEAPDYNIGVISKKEAIQRFELDQYFSELPAGETQYLLFEGDDVVFDRDLDIAQLCKLFSQGKQTIAGLMVSGNMIVEGKVFTSDLMLFVTGNLCVANPMKNNSKIVIKGTIKATQSQEKDTTKKRENMWNTPFPYPYTIITEEEAMKRFVIDKNKYRHSSYGWDNKATYIFIDQNVSFAYDIETDGLCQLLKKEHEKVDGIIIHGNVTIEGVLLQTDPDRGKKFFVSGDLTAKSILKGGAEFHIKGNVKVAQTIYGLYNHGMLTVAGNITASVIFRADHYHHFEGETHALIIDINTAETAGIDYRTTEPLLPEIADDLDLIGEYIMDGKHIVQEKFLYQK